MTFIKRLYLLILIWTIDFYVNLRSFRNKWAWEYILTRSWIVPPPGIVLNIIFSRVLSQSSYQITYFTIFKVTLHHLPSLLSLIYSHLAIFASFFIHLPRARGVNKFWDSSPPPFCFESYFLPNVTTKTLGFNWLTQPVQTLNKFAVAAGGDCRGCRSPFAKKKVPLKFLEILKALFKLILFIQICRQQNNFLNWGKAWYCSKGKEYDIFSHKSKQCMPLIFLGEIKFILFP